MARGRFAPVLFLCFGLASLTSAVQFTPTVHTGLSERHAAITAYESAHPRNGSSRAMTPFKTGYGASDWAWRSVSESKRYLAEPTAYDKLDITRFQDSPTDSKITKQLSKGFTEFTQYFTAGIKSGDVFDVPTRTKPAPTTTPRPTMEASSGSGSSEQDSGVVRNSVYDPIVLDPSFFRLPPLSESRGADVHDLHN